MMRHANNCRGTSETARRRVLTKERAPEPRGWTRVSRFDSADEARVVYEALRDLLTLDDLDASTFRFTVNGASHVALLGEDPLAATTEERVHSLLGRGVVSEVPIDVSRQLQERRSRFRSTGLEFYERRNQDR